MEPDGSTDSDVPDASTDIKTVSSRQSSPDELTNDECTTFPDSQEIFHTPPRYRSPSNSPSFYDCNDDGIIGGGDLYHDGETANVGSKRAVDLGKDVDTPKRLKTHSDSEGTFHTESDGIMGIQLPGESLGTGPQESDPVTGNNSIMDKSLVVSTEGIECDAGNMKVECQNDNVQLPSLVDEDPEANSRAGDEGFKQIPLLEEIIDTESRSELLDSGPKEGNTETESNSIEVSIKGKSFDSSTEGIECDTENMNVECENDTAEASSEKNLNMVEDIDSAGNGSNSCGSEVEKSKKNVVLPSLGNAHPEANSRARDEGLKQIPLVEQFMDTESPSETFGIGQEVRNAEAENNSIKVSIMGKCLDVSTEGVKCDTENRKVECVNDIGEGNSEINRDIVEEIDAAGNGSNSCGLEQEKTKKNGVLHSSVDVHLEANSRAGDEGLKQNTLVEGFMDIEPPTEPLCIGPEEGNAETENKSTEVSIKGKSLDVSTVGTACDTKYRKVECGNDIGEGNSEININIVEEIDPTGNGSNPFGTEDEKTNKNSVLASLTDEHPEINSRAGDEGVQRILLSDVLRKVAKNEPEEDLLACLSLLEVAERKWGPF